MLLAVDFYSALSENGMELFDELVQVAGLAITTQCNHRPAACKVMLQTLYVNPAGLVSCNTMDWALRNQPYAEAWRMRCSKRVNFELSPVMSTLGYTCYWNPYPPILQQMNCDSYVCIRYGMRDEGIHPHPSKSH